MRTHLFDIMAQCEFGDWVGMAVLLAIGLLSVTFLGLGSVLIV